MKYQITANSVHNDDPMKNVKATEDFLSKVLAAYIVTSAKELLKANLETIKFEDLAQLIIKKYEQLLSVSTDTDKSDCILTYSCEVIILGLLWDSFHDAKREGDGKRIMMRWKFLLIVFHMTNKINYRKEDIILLGQYSFLFSKRKAKQLAYGRFVNTHGQLGCNIPSNLYQQHLNRRLKAAIHNLHSEVGDPAISRAAKYIGIVNSICEQFERDLRKAKAIPNAWHSTK